MPSLVETEWHVQASFGSNQKLDSIQHCVYAYRLVRVILSFGLPISATLPATSGILLQGRTVDKNI